MPPVTRSQARKRLDDVRATPYASKTLARWKKHAQADDLVRLFDREDTPDPWEVIDEFFKVHNSMSEKLSHHSGLHHTSDILFNASVVVRKYIRDNTSPKQDTTAFIKAWMSEAKSGSLDDDTTPQADLLRRFIAEKESKKSPTPESQAEAFRKYKMWLVLYDERCKLVHGGLQDKSDQEIWDVLKQVEQDIKAEKLTFSKPDAPRYVLEAIQDVRNFKFIITDESITTKSKIPIKP